MIMRFRKKPVEILALKYTGENYIEIMEWARSNNVHIYKMRESESLVIPTLEGNHEAKIGDFIIQGIKGEFYPCKPDIFEMTYEIVEGRRA